MNITWRVMPAKESQKFGEAAKQAQTGCRFASGERMHHIPHGKMEVQLELTRGGMSLGIGACSERGLHCCLGVVHELPLMINDSYWLLKGLGVGSIGSVVVVQGDMLENVRAQGVPDDRRSDICHAAGSHVAHPGPWRLCGDEGDLFAVLHQGDAHVYRTASGVLRGRNIICAGKVMSSTALQPQQMFGSPLQA